MKRIWSYDYLEQREGSPRAVAEWVSRQSQLYSEQTGVSWTGEIVGSTMRIVFTPYMRFRETQSIEGYEAMIENTLRNKAKGRLFGCVSFGELIDAIPGLSAYIIMGTAKALVIQGRARLQVNRQGKPTMISLSIK